ncbi:MAG: imidazole glycerol phosphate synthase, glutamine amidotransferase subunit [Omnitrophica bacterium GWA2_52_8]|nr:MAG: imidazole glycerol phosphate synthase, glutamine amidotransferase subunit [Omnitrophica bacterium GWA2_52_8]
MIAVIDYGMGNLRSVSKALELMGARVCVSSDPEVIGHAQKVILPGVGAFGQAMTELEKRKLTAPLRQFISSGGPFLGICLGLQLLFEFSKESEGVPGLALLSGDVRSFDPSQGKIPHMGWNSVDLQIQHPLLSGIKNRSYFYFVHSYYGVPRDQNTVAGICRYGSQTFAAMIAWRNIFATQFHPEKSQSAGLKLLENFTHWNGHSSITTAEAIR